MKFRLLNIKFLFLLLCGTNQLLGQDTLNYEGHHFKGSFVLIDSLGSKTSTTNKKRIKDIVLDDYDQIIVPFDYLNFSHTKQDSALNFRLLDFKGDVDFSFSKFYSANNFNGCAFEGWVDFTAVDFNTISKTAEQDRNSTTSNTSISFFSSYFKSYAQFQGLTCNNPISFGLCLFDSTANFSRSSFNEYASFGGCRFSQNLYFNDADFKNGADFSDIVLPDTLDFYNVKTEKEIELTTAVLDSSKNVCYINLARSDINRIRLNYNLYKLYFYPNEKENEITSVYQKLLKKFKDEGFEDSYQKLDIEFQKYKYEQSGQWFRSWIQEWWWNYGYNKEKVFRNTFSLLFFFFFINVLIGFKWGYNFLIKEVYEIQNIETEVDRLEAKYERNKVRLFVAWLPMIFIYTGMLFFILNLNVKHLRFTHKWALMYVLTVFIVGLACAAYIINFVLDK